uniref:SUF system FeS cluster assembly SufBD core domain-containing protein n=1 Tax=candidate division WWE3 bacterium TaxID=2053526 RepID=A0A7C4TP78_UNCKA
MRNVFVKGQNETLDFSVEEDTRLIVVPSGEVSVNVEVVKEGVSAELVVLYALHGDASVSLATNSVHKIPHTSCNVIVRSALFDSSKSSFEGKIYIGKEAQGTVSYLEDNVLSVGDKVKNSSKPILEILADDVKASHGATTGRLDETSLYYLQSRGLSREEAERLSIEGFFESVLGKIDDAEVLAAARKELHV